MEAQFEAAQVFYFIPEHAVALIVSLKTGAYFVQRQNNPHTLHTAKDQNRNCINKLVVRLM